MVVTGGGTGIGRCTAHELASLGAEVVIASRNRSALEQTAAEITEAGGACGLVELDLRDEASISGAVEEVLARYGRIDGLFNNAGGQFAAPVEKLSANGWRSVIDLNLNGTYLMTRAVFDQHMKANGGAIVCMLADIWNGYPAMAHMAAARAGIENLCRTLTLEWSAYDVRLNCIAPGTILSSGLTTYPPEIQDFTVEQTQHIPAARLGTESEVSAAAVFLLSDASRYIRGATLRIDGGEALQKRRLLPVTGHQPTQAFEAFPLAPDLSGTKLASLKPQP